MESIPGVGLLAGVTGRFDGTGGPEEVLGRVEPLLELEMLLLERARLFIEFVDVGLVVALFVGLAGTTGGLLVVYPAELLAAFVNPPLLDLSSLAGTKLPVDMNFWGFGGVGTGLGL